MPKILNAVGAVVLFGSIGAALIGFNEVMKSGSLTYMAVTCGVGALLLACGGMLLLAAATALEKLTVIAISLRPR